MKRLTVLLFGLFLVGCTEEPPVPDQPTWFQDVRPIFLAQCARCHAPPAQGFPGGIRGGGSSFACYSDVSSLLRIQQGVLPWLTGGVESCTVAGGGPGNCVMPPPPAPPLSDRQIRIIERWVETANGDQLARGEGDDPNCP